MNRPSDLLMQSVFTRCVLACEISQPAHGVANEVCEEMMTVASRTVDPAGHLIALILELGGTASDFNSFHQPYTVEKQALQAHGEQQMNRQEQYVRYIVKMLNRLMLSSSKDLSTTTFSS